MATDLPPEVVGEEVRTFEELPTRCADLLRTVRQLPGADRTLPVCPLQCAAQGLVMALMRTVSNAMHQHLPGLACFIVLLMP